MAEVIVDISMTLDGFVTGPDPDEAHGLGVGGEPIHHWAMEHRTDADQAVLDRSIAATGVVIMGRRLFDVIDGPHGWDDEVGYGGEHPQADGPPVIVVTHQAPGHVRLGDRFSFATDGIHDAIARAKTVAAATDQDVVVMGGAGVIQSVLTAGLADQFWIHLAPVLFGAGTRLFDQLPVDVTELTPIDTTSTPHATHLRYRFPH
ncbi:dihydrofolate reductase family protein [soil metagenome]